MNDDRTRVLAPDRAPTPFTAAEIRAGCPAGRQVRLEVRVAGAEPYVRVTRFLTGTEETAVQQTQRFDLEGHPLDEPVQVEAGWRDLQAHASFPADRTAVDHQAVDTALGRLDCLRYTVTEGNRVDVYWFAEALPGMPVRTETRQHGEVVSTMEMVASTSV